MRVLLFDMEADGLMPDVTKVHCCVAKEMLTGRVIKFFDPIKDLYPDEEKLEFPLKYLKGVFSLSSTIIGHNIIGYDNDLLDQFFYLDNMLSKVNVLDTLVWSQTLNPDRKLPPGCPTSIPNPVTGGNDKVGPHSVHAWGYRVARAKPSHHDWTTFSPEMLHRCEEDVAIQELIFFELLKEAGLTVEDVYK